MMRQMVNQFLELAENQHKCNVPELSETDPIVGKDVFFCYFYNYDPYWDLLDHWLPREVKLFLIPLFSPLRHPKDGEANEVDFSSDEQSNVYDIRFKEWYVYNSDEEEHILEESILVKSYEEGMVKLSSPCCEIDDHMSSNYILLLPSSLTCSPLLPSLKYYYVKPIDDYV